MQQLCAADVDVPLGSLTYTGMLNPHGGYEADVTVTRVGEAEFLVVSGTAQATKDMAWIRRQIRALGLNAVATDVSSSYAVLGLMGPEARNLLADPSAVLSVEAGFNATSLTFCEVTEDRLRAWSHSPRVH